jgi:hypothetical protein
MTVSPVSPYRSWWDPVLSPQQRRRCGPIPARSREQAHCDENTSPFSPYERFQIKRYQSFILQNGGAVEKGLNPENPSPLPFFTATHFPPSPSYHHPLSPHPSPGLPSTRLSPFFHKQPRTQKNTLRAINQIKCQEDQMTQMRRHRRVTATDLCLFFLFCQIRPVRF